MRVHMHGRLTYVGELEEMERCVLRAVEQHACGVFVVPHERVKQPKHEWEQALAKSMLLRLELPKDVLIGAGWSTELYEPLWAVMASFDFAGGFKAKRRKERAVGLARARAMLEVRESTTAQCEARVMFGAELELWGSSIRRSRWTRGGWMEVK